MSELYNIAAYKLMVGQFVWPATEMVLAAWGGTPLYVATHTTVAQLRAATGASELGVSLPITERTVAADGTGQTNQMVIPGLTVGAVVTWFTLCVDNVDPTLREPILFIDEGFGLPYTSNGLDMIVQPDWVSMRGLFRP